MDDLKRAAIVLRSMGKAAASRVLNHLPREQMERLTTELARTGDVSQEEQDEAIQKFRDAVDSRTLIERDSLSVSSEPALQTEDVTPEIVESERPSLNFQAFQFLRPLKPRDVAKFIREEHPQTIALIMSNLPTGQAADILNDLPPEMQLDVVRRVAGMDRTTPGIIQEIEHSLQMRMGSLSGMTADVISGEPLSLNINAQTRTTDTQEADRPGIRRAA